MPTRYGYFEGKHCPPDRADGGTQVIQRIGLCICLYDLLWTSEGLIGHGTGLVNVNGSFARSHVFVIFSFADAIYAAVEFRMIVFRPFKGEVIIARVRSQTPSGMHLSVGDFFQDIFVPYEEMPEGVE
jgi:DNA-directed RNA polymerase III subunit RPC8